MDYTSIHFLKSYCCTCLCQDRKLEPLYRIHGGVNNLYSLLSFDSEAYREGFHMETGALHMCWECKALLRRFTQFRQQACVAQKTLAAMLERSLVAPQTTLSRLAIQHQPSPNLQPALTTDKPEDIAYVAQDVEGTDQDIDNFIDCGPADVKTEDDTDDVPLSRLKGSYKDAIASTEKKADRKVNSIEYDSKKSFTTTKDKKKKIPKRQKQPAAKVKLKKSISEYRLSKQENKAYFTSIELTKEELLESIEQRKRTISYLNASYKCETCIYEFKLLTEFERHNLELHSEKPGHSACAICRCFIKNTALKKHVKIHYFKQSCSLCDYVTYSVSDVVSHLKIGHAVKKLNLTTSRLKGQCKARAVLKPGSKPRMNQSLRDKKTPFGYLCTDCGKYFDNKNQRWKHIQRHHREGHACGACGKRFAFKSNRARHEATHSQPPPRVSCPVCHKRVRADLTRAHARTHARRDTSVCAPCGKTFVSLASYEHHLKYTRAHTTLDVLKYKCADCDKGYRSRGELRDHVNYQHLQKTLHKCPICDKALATRRCITRHVRRAHHGVKEAPRDKICQLCGKAFRDKKGLHEHERTHTGERPLTCDTCGASFRQSASLYTHRRRVHKIAPRTITVQHTTGHEQPTNDHQRPATTIERPVTYREPTDAVESTM